MRALPFIALGILLYFITDYLVRYQPELMTNLLVQVDVFGLTQIAENEQDRLQNIKNLTIPYEEKEVLVNRKVFMGCTPEMAKLALGEPNIKPKPMANEKQDMLTYVYYLPNDKRPTVLVFEREKLIDAHKGSAIDYGN